MYRYATLYVVGRNCLPLPALEVGAREVTENQRVPTMLSPGLLSNIMYKSYFNLLFHRVLKVDSYKLL